MNAPTLELEVWSEYTAESPLDHDGLTDVTVIGIDPERIDSVHVDTGEMRGHIPLHTFCANVEIPEKYESVGVSTKFVPRGVVISTQELFDSDNCHFCESILDHHHHVSYIPETVLPVCQSCHSRLHRGDGFHPELTPESGRPNGYSSSFKRLWKKYRYAVGDDDLFFTEDGFDHPRPTMTSPRDEMLLESMGILGVGSDV